MSAVLRRLACLLLVFTAVPLSVAKADLQALASAAYEYRNQLYNLKAFDGDAQEAADALRSLSAGQDQVAAENQAESMVPAGYENYELWIALATGQLAWADAVEGARVQASGERTDLTPYLPLP